MPMPDDKEMVEITVIGVHSTDKAMLVAPDEESTAVWLPRSQVRDMREVGRTKAFAKLGDDPRNKAGADGAAIVEMKVPVWLAKKAGLV
jgi:hypothetical protein